MRFNLVTHLSNGAGLQRDYEMLRAELERRGHEVQGLHFKEAIEVPPQADINVFLEVVVPSLFSCARQNWCVPNPEWWYRQWPLDCWDLVLTKTQDATRIFRRLVGDRCEYLGWQARDVYDPSVPRQRAFLHVAGKSRSKNTPAVLAGAKQAGVPVTVIAEGHQQRVSDEELAQLQNTHLFCLLPSAYEGYGHSLHEAYGCGQVVLTTDAAPMNETGPAILIPPQHRRTHHCGVLHEVSGKAVAHAIRHALALSDDEIATMSQEIRAAFAFQRAQFQQNLDRVLERCA